MKNYNRVISEKGRCISQIGSLSMHKTDAINRKLFNFGTLLLGNEDLKLIEINLQLFKAD